MKMMTLMKIMILIMTSLINILKKEQKLLKIYYISFKNYGLFQKTDGKIKNARHEYGNSDG